MLGGCQHKPPKQTGGMLKLARWLRTVRKNSSESSFHQLSVVLSERLISQASSAKGVACTIKRITGKSNRCCTTQWAERVDVRKCETLPCRLASEKHRICPKWSQMQSHSQNFPEDHPPDPLAVACLCTHYEPDHLEPDRLKSDGYGPVNWINSK